MAGAMAVAGCGRYAVKAKEKQYLADRIMAFDEDEQEAAADEDLAASREGSKGSTTTPKRAGCGCE